MTLPVVYLPGARDDIDDAFVHYERQRAGLGARFADALQEHIRRIQNNPALYGVVYQDVRAALIKRFPYVVYHRIESDRILIVAVQHGRRDWSNWQSRT